MVNLKPGDVVRHKNLNILGRIIHVPDGTDKMHYKIDWLTPTNCDRIVTEWWVYEHLEYCELGTILDLESKSKNLLYNGGFDFWLSDGGKELQLCNRYYEKSYDRKK